MIPHIHAYSLGTHICWKGQKRKIWVWVISAVSTTSIGDEKSWFLHLMMKKILYMCFICVCILFVLLGFSSWIFFCLYFWYCTNSYWGWGGVVRVMNALVFLEISLIRDSWDLGLNSGLSNNPQGSLKWVALSLGTSVSSFVKWVT